MYRPPGWLRALLLFACLSAAALWLLSHREALDAAAITAFIDDFGAAAGLLFMAIHIVGSLLFLPRTVLAIAAGALFGFWGGLFVGLAGATLGAVAGFVAARYVNGGLLVAEELPHIGPLLARAESGGWKLVFATRLIPVLPHTLINYAFGLTRVPLASFAVGSVLGFLPIQIVCAEIGDSGRFALTGTSDWLQPLLWGGLFLAVVLALPHLLRRALGPHQFGTLFGFPTTATTAMPSDARPDIAMSEALRRVAEGPPEQEVKIGEVLVNLGAQAHLLALVLLAAPNLTPGPSLPGFSTILGLPLCIVAAQLMVGLPRLWLPRRLTEMSISRRRLAALMARAIPLLQRIERLMRPRWLRLVGGGAIRPLGAACLALGVILCLPIPVFSMAPAAAILLVALGAIAYDGAAVALGLTVGVASVVLLAALAWLAVATMT